jgi:hypothetical protein
MNIEDVNLDFDDMILSELIDIQYIIKIYKVTNDELELGLKIKNYIDSKKQLNLRKLTF